MVVAVAALTVSCAGGGSSARGRSQVPLCIGTDSVGTTSFRFGKALGDVLNAHISGTRWSVTARSASVANIDLLSLSACDLLVLPADAAADAVAGDGASRPPRSLQALACLYDNVVQLVTLDGSGVSSIDDLRNQAVWTGPSGSGTDFVARRLLVAAGLRPGTDVRLAEIQPEDPGQADDALAAGRIKAFFWSGQMPDPQLQSLTDRGLKLRLVRLDTELSALERTFRTTSSMYTPIEIPARIYGLDSDVTTIGVPNYLVVTPTMDPDIAYQITRLLFAHAGEIVAAVPEAGQISVQSAFSTGSVPLHPGAKRYYREIKP